LQLSQGLTHNGFGNGGAFATLAGNAQRLADITVTAATLKDRVPDLPISNTLAEADIHK
jgi:hypothetical protein